MFPKELQRDAAGDGRLERIEKADVLLAQARLMAAAYAADPKRGFEEFAAELCESCSSSQECGTNLYLARVEQAADLYRAAGLGRLSLRTRAILRRPPADAWRRFDELNARHRI